jgi:serine protease Do
MVRAPARFPIGIAKQRGSFRGFRFAVPAAIAIAVYCAGLVPGLAPMPGAMSQAEAQGIPRPVGFAEIVDKVKPAVISVRVKIDAGRRTRDSSPFPQDSPLDRFFRRFGEPEARCPA